MAINQLPPQAYTRDMLSAAFEWLHTQPASIREIATDSDSLVSLYLQSRRRSDSNARRIAENNSLTDASADAFKQDLKTLAEGLKQFDDSKLDSQGLAHSPLSQNPVAQAYPSAPLTPPPSAHRPTPPPSTPHSSLGAGSPTSSRPAPARNSSLPPELDSKSIEMIRAVHARLNLSSESEALRMLISLGFDRIRDILPKN